MYVSRDVEEGIDLVEKEAGAGSLEPRPSLCLKVKRRNHFKMLVLS